MNFLIPLLFLSVGADAPKTVQPPKLPEAPRIVASPSGATTAPESTPLDVGRFIFLSMPEYDGKITWDGFDKRDEVRAFPVNGGMEYPGVKQGDTLPDAHVAPQSKSRVLMVFGVKPGVLTLAAWGSKDGEAVKLAVITLNVGGAPQPQPKPFPQPEPSPFVGKWRFVVIEETEQAANNRGQYFTDADLLAYVKAKCVAAPRIADQDVKDSTGKPPKDLEPYLSRAKGKKLPQLYVISDAGKVLFEGDLPETPAKLLQQLRFIGGP